MSFEIEGAPLNLLNPPAIIVQAEVFDEQALKREWDEATADEQDATERKVVILQKALKRWPTVPGSGYNGRRHSPEMRRFVRDVLGMPDQKGGGMNTYALRLIKHGMEGTRVENARINTRRIQGAKIRRAVIELTTKYQLGADPAACMDALVALMKEPK